MRGDDEMDLDTRELAYAIMYALIKKGIITEQDIMDCINEDEEN
jgi:hypothetical protein